MERTHWLGTFMVLLAILLAYLGIDSMLEEQEVLAQAREDRVVREILKMHWEYAAKDMPFDERLQLARILLKPETEVEEVVE